MSYFEGGSHESTSRIEAETSESCRKTCLMSLETVSGQVRDMVHVQRISITRLRALARFRELLLPELEEESDGRGVGGEAWGCVRGGRPAADPIGLA